MKAEYGKCYELDNSKSYFCVQLQRRVKFTDKLCVKCGSGACFRDDFHFGNLIDISPASDNITNNEIEFLDEDVIGEYYITDITTFIYQTNNFLYDDYKTTR